MNKNDFKNPLIQSGAILLLVFLLISIVAGSGSQGLWGSIGALISGIFSAVIFIIALTIAIVFSIAVIVGVYLAAVSIYSKEKGRDLWEQLKISLCAFYHKVRGTEPREPISEPTVAPVMPEQPKAAAPEPPAKPQPVQQAQAEPAKPQTEPAEPQVAVQKNQFDAINARLAELTQSSAAQAETIAVLKQQIDDLADTSDQQETEAPSEHAHQELSDQLNELGTKVEAGSAAMQALESQIGEQIDEIKSELASLHDKTSVPETVSGILAYIDSPEDRDLITEKAKEAISRGMTYAQIDDFFKSSLSGEVYKELAAHPRLTKDFLRSIKKKF